MTWLALLLSATALAPSVGGDCAALKSAHRALVESSFTCERHFRVRLNGNLKAREVTRLDYQAGRLVREILEKEILDKNLVLEDGEAESALALPFDCALVEIGEGGRVHLENADGSERVAFAWDRERGALRPERWENHESTRILWKKLTIDAVAEYENFSWRGDG